jgi:hypothetical protein
MMELREPGIPFEGAIPGRSARGRYTAQGVFIYLKRMTLITFGNE